MQLHFSVFLASMPELSSRGFKFENCFRWTVYRCTTIECIRKRNRKISEIIQTWSIQSKLNYFIEQLSRDFPYVYKYVVVSCIIDNKIHFKWIK